MNDFEELPPVDLKVSMRHRDSGGAILSEISLDRIPPHSIPAEQGVLGCMMMSSEAISMSMEKLKGGPEAFYDLRHRMIYECLVGMFEKKQPVDLITVQQRLRDSGQLDEVGGIVYLADLVNAVPSVSNLEYYSGILDEKLKARKLIKIAGEAIGLAYDATGEVIDQTIDQLGTWAAKIGMGSIRGERSLKEIMENLISQFQAERKGIYANVVATGLHDFDHRFQGLTLGEMTVLAARPSVGKTAMMIQVAHHIANTFPVGIISIEMTSESLMRRMAGSVSGLNMRAIKDFSEPQMMRLASTMIKLSGLPIRIHDQSEISIMEIKSIIRGWVTKHGIKVAMIDYLQLAKGSSERSRAERRLEVEEISAGLKSIAKDLNIAVFALCQLNREIEKRGNGAKPKLSDLKESGAIEQDADQVCFLWSQNDDQDGKSLVEEIDEPGKKQIITISVAKQRNGPVGDASMLFDKQTQRFLPLSRTELPAEYYSTHP